MDQIQSDLGLNYRMSVLPRGRWIFLDLGLAASLSTSKMPLRSIPTTAVTIPMNGKTFDSGTLAVKAGNTAFGAKGIIGLAVRMGKQYELFVDGHYLLPFIKRDYVQFKENQGFFLSRKSAKVDWDDPDLHFYVDNASISKPRFEVEPYYFRLGIRSGF
jgi:hypothetical protein